MLNKFPIFVIIRLKYITNGLIKINFLSKIMCYFLIFSFLLNFDTTAKNPENSSDKCCPQLSTAQLIGSSLGPIAALLFVFPLCYKFTIKNNKDLSEMSFTINDDGNWTPSRCRVYFNIVNSVSIPMALAMSIELGSEIGIYCAKIIENTFSYLANISSKSMSL